MLNTRRFVAAFTLSLAALGALMPATANAGNLVGHLGIGEMNSTTAVEVALGYRFTADRFFIAPAAGIEVSQGEDNTRYETQTQRNGTEVCRDTSNGQYSNKENCAGNYDGRGFVSLEAGYKVTDNTSIGLGVRRAEITSPYAVVNFGSAAGFKFRLAAGKEYASAGVSLGF